MYSKVYKVKDEHLDFQDVVDGLYYPFYMEDCRHSFMKDVFGLDLEKEFNEGRVYMLLEYVIKFKKSLKKDDVMIVTCEVGYADKKNRMKFTQKIIINNTIYSEAEFIATCLINSRPSIPKEIINMIEN